MFRFRIPFVLFQRLLAPLKSTTFQFPLRFNSCWNDNFQGTFLTRRASVVKASPQVNRPNLQTPPGDLKNIKFCKFGIFKEKSGDYRCTTKTFFLFLSLMLVLIYKTFQVYNKNLINVDGSNISLQLRKRRESARYTCLSRYLWLGTVIFVTKYKCKYLVNI